ncbi:MAG: ATP-binding protein [Gammaproteobacteria bacterium]|nr:ATP-binding protein [Gammaproteobacteria bacterium]MDH5802135.1 ATP-binding protein [Gammaproteobacteria bacterium]
MTLSIKKRLLVSLLSLMAVACSLTLVKNYFDTQYEIEELFDAQLAQAARVLLELSAHELHEQLAFSARRDGEDSEISEPIAVQVHKYQQEIDFQIWVNNNLLAVRTENAPRQRFTQLDNQFEDKILGNQPWRVYSVSNESNTIRVQVGQHYDERHVLANNISTRLIASFSLMLPLLALLITFSVDRAMIPLNNIAKDLKQRHYDNFEPISLKKIPAEAQPMIQAINTLFNRLQVAFGNIIQFTANAAHELRTPLAALKVHAQNAKRAQCEQTRNEALDEVVEGVDKATSLVEQLLTLSRLDPETQIKKSETTNLHKVVEEQLANLAPLALKKDIELSLYNELQIEGSQIQGREGLIKILVTNLVQNAIRYTPRNGCVDVQIDSHFGHTMLRVSDSGPGIAPVEREQVFKRFYRIRGSTEQGTGLGLSMVKRIVELHNVQIVLDKSIYGGLQVDVLFNNATPKLVHIRDAHKPSPQLVTPA